MKKIFFIIFLILFSMKVHSQVSDHYYSAIQYNATPGNCDGAATVDWQVAHPNFYFEWYTYSPMTLIGTNDSIGGLCPGLYVLVIYDPYCDYFYSYFQIDSSGNPIQTEVHTHHDLFDEYENYITISINGVNPPYDYYLDDFNLFNIITLGNYTPVTDTIFTDFLNVNKYQLGVFDSIGNKIIDIAYPIVYDSTWCLPEPFTSAAQGLPVSDSALCDGGAYGYGYGGTPPYTYSYSSGTTMSIDTALCPGLYQLTVSDAASHMHSSSFVVGYPNTIYFSDPDGFNYIDTLYTNALADCNFDYSIPVDSVVIDTSFYFSPNIETVVWLVYQDTNIFELTENYYYDTAGYYYFGLSVYCETRSVGFNSFTFYDDYFLPDRNSSTVGFTKNTINDFNLFPNPASDRVKISLRNNLATENNYQLYNLMGSLVKTGNFYGNETWINTTALADGVYTLVIGGETKKLVISR